MIELTVAEAQLFRLLVPLFGKDAIMVNMSLYAVLNGVVSEEYKKYLCLFTIINGATEAKLVVDLLVGDRQTIDLQRIESAKIIRDILRAQGVRYVAVTGRDLQEILDPDSELDFVTYLTEKTKE